MEGIKPRAFVQRNNKWALFKPGFHLVAAVAGVFVWNCVKLCEILQRPQILQQPEIPERPSDFHLVAGVAEEDLLFPVIFILAFFLFTITASINGGFLFLFQIMPCWPMANKRWKPFQILKLFRSWNCISSWARWCALFSLQETSVGWSDIFNLFTASDCDRSWNWLTTASTHLIFCWSPYCTCYKDTRTQGRRKECKIGPTIWKEPQCDNYWSDQNSGNTSLWR